MKKLIYFFAGSFLLCLSSNASAQYFEEGGIAYNVLSATEHTVEVAPLECTYYRGHYNIPSTVVHNQVMYDVVALGEEAFSNSAVYSVTIPSSVTRIKHSCFLFAYGLTTINIPASVTDIEELALAVDGLTAINVDESNPSYRSIDGVLFSKDSTTAVECPTGKNGIVILPQNTTHIAPGAFAYCKRITGVTLPEGLLGIGASAFFGNHLLDNIVIPASVTHMGANLFANCKVLNNLTLEEGNTHYFMNGMQIYSMGGDTLLSCHKSADSVFLPNTVRVVYGFLYNKNIKYVHLPESVTTIGDNAFGSSSLKGIDMPSRLAMIDEYAFYGCSLLSQVRMPDTLDRMGARVFESCSSLTTIEIPNGLRIIPENTFYDCRSLSHIIWGDAVETIGQYAFYHNTVDELYLPATLRVVGMGAFAYGRMRKGVFSAPVDTLEVDVFYGYQMESLRLKNNMPPATTEYGCLIGATVDSIIIPCGSREAYLADDYWGQFSDRYYEDCNGIDAPTEFELSVYPNPATDYIAVQGIRDCRRVELINTLGQSVLSRNIADDSIEIDVRGLERGIYILRLYTTDSMMTSKFILQ